MKFFARPAHRKIFSSVFDHNALEEKNIIDGREERKNSREDTGAV